MNLNNLVNRLNMNFNKNNFNLFVKIVVLYRCKMLHIMNKNNHKYNNNILNLN